MPQHLPVDALREPFLDALDRGPIVITAPTGTGKSTRVPQWCPGRVLVIEPRRVACQSLAARVAEEQGVTLGEEVGYRVRDDHRVTDATRLLFVTPGMALQMRAEWPRFAAVVVDEFHERHMDTDLLLALLQQQRPARLTVMSATLEAERLAEHLGGRHLRAEGRLHPVDIEHRAEGVLLPSAARLAERVRSAVEEAARDEGDILVFLPGKAEIAAAQQSLAGLRELDVMPLHGGLDLAAQARAFQIGKRRRVILATNVAETSVTVPGVTTVIDSGLVRRTRYHRGRGYLARVPVAIDSAEQRAGRAGRLGPGRCVRLWDAAARLEARTPPEVHRESLVPLVLGATASGADPRQLPFFDPPKEHALAAAMDELQHLGAVDETGGITRVGRELFRLPIDAWLGRLLQCAREQGVLQDAVDLVAALMVSRPWLSRIPDDEDDDAEGCDATLWIRAVRGSLSSGWRIAKPGLHEALRHRRRLQQAFSVSAADPDAPVDKRGLAMAALAADPRCAYVARRRKKHIGWSNGGTEIELARESAASGRQDIHAALVLDSRAVEIDPRRTKVVGTCVVPVPLAWLVEAGIGRDRLAGVTLQDGMPVARVERVHARKVLEVREEAPRGALAREALAELWCRGSWFRRAASLSRDRLEALSLARRMRLQPAFRGLDVPEKPVPEPRAWVLERLEQLGVEEAEDAALLSPEDLTVPPLPYELEQVLERELPRSLQLGGARYRVDYDLDRRQVMLNLVEGQMHKPPPAVYLPKFRGFRVFIEAGGTMHPVR